MTLPASAVTHEFANLPNGTYYFAVRAFNSANAHSTYSNEVRVVVICRHPAISSVSPSSGPAEGGTGVTIAGTDFQAGAVVSFGEIHAAILSQTNTSITVIAPPGIVGAVPVTIANTDGASVTMDAGFIYNASEEPVSTPAITSLTPATGPTAGGTTITINGTDFRAGATVLVGGTPATVTAATDRGRRSLPRPTAPAPSLSP